MTNPHAEWLAKLADFIRDALSPSEYQRLKFCAEMLEALDGRPSEPGCSHEFIMDYAAPYARCTKCGHVPPLKSEGGQ